MLNVALKTKATNRKSETTTKQQAKNNKTTTNNQVTITIITHQTIPSLWIQLPSEKVFNLINLIKRKTPQTTFLEGVWIPRAYITPTKHPVNTAPTLAKSLRCFASSVDLNGDGLVQYEEFLRWCLGRLQKGFQSFVWGQGFCSVVKGFSNIFGFSRGFLVFS